MKFTLTFLQDNQAMFKSMLQADSLDYIAFYENDGLYIIAETWEDEHKSTFIIEC